MSELSIKDFEDITIEQKPRIGVGVLARRHDKVLLGKRIGERYGGFYAFPGGSLEFGETVSECALRELFEETGIVGRNPIVMHVIEHIDADEHWISIIVKVTVPHSQEAVVKEKDKCESWDWYSRKALPKPLFWAAEKTLSVL